MAVAYAWRGERAQFLQLTTKGKEEVFIGGTAREGIYEKVTDANVLQWTKEERGERPAKEHPVEKKRLISFAEGLGANRARLGPRSSKTGTAFSQLGKGGKKQTLLAVAFPKGAEACIK